MVCAPGCCDVLLYGGWSWLCDASLLLLSLCVDVLLVCAEGCTQVTGVMAMMMAGRVLLVCALCVLWCGLSGIAADGVGVVSDGSADEDLLLHWRAWLRRESAEEVSRRTGGSANASAVEECVHQEMDGVRAVVDGRRRWRRQRIAVAAAAGNGDVITDKDGQARNNEVSPPEIKDEKPVASGQESTDATRGKDQTTQNPSVAIVSRTKLISDQKQEGRENDRERRWRQRR
ncbi:mucin-associated surface protein (MASP) [Trypanosoma cruzi Dm28c]|uniref:Mucin-associated surface protein (MASP) n=1 Tax=Trypanosoma cruzi Dm28c TaxID=1416333 RepID=V5D4B8_TRYCR|nr:mucin-associated surface protein (MASP) [Trypanosoma cruzi Dm28c]